MTSDETEEPIDAVIAWVDGSDPHHAARRAAALEAVGITTTARNGVNATRFSDLGEIYYCIASILKYAPFVRRIHVVCDQQRPEFLGYFADEGICARDRIITVDHTAIFRGYEAALPTFNSCTIETMLWRIPNLAEHFLYFNDDFFVNAPLQRSDLLTNDGQMRIRGKVRRVWPHIVKNSLRWMRYKIFGGRAPRAGFKRGQALAAQLLGMRYYLQFDHAAHILKKSTLEQFFSVNNDILSAQISHQFRDSSQFLPVALANHLAIKKGFASVEPAWQEAVITRDRHNQDDVLTLIRDEAVPFGCVQSLDAFTRAERDEVRDIMARKFEKFLPQAITAAFARDMCAAPPAQYN